jgi:hypothetical protein
VPGEACYIRSFSSSARGGGPGLPEVRRDEFSGQFDDRPYIPKLYLLSPGVRGAGPQSAGSAGALGLERDQSALPLRLQTGLHQTPSVAVLQRSWEERGNCVCS